MSEKKPNGLRTAVKYGTMTKAEALAKYEKMSKKSGLKSEVFVKWLMKYRGAK